MHYGNDTTATVTTAGRELTARIQQFVRAAYVTVWDDTGLFLDASVQRPDARAEMGLVLAGESDLHPSQQAVLRRAAAIFALHEAKTRAGLN